MTRRGSHSGGCHGRHDWYSQAGGVKLGWLIDPDRREVHVHRPGQQPEVHTNAESVAGDDDLLPGFVLDLTKVWTGK